MPGWIVHSYLTVPGLSTVVVNVWPLPNSADLNAAPLLATASWSTVSSFSQQIFWPARALVFSGSNLMFAILITTASLAQACDEPAVPPLSSPPQPASAATTTTIAGHLMPASPPPADGRRGGRGRAPAPSRRPRGRR